MLLLLLLLYVVNPQTLSPMSPSLPLPFDVLPCALPYGVRHITKGQGYRQKQGQKCPMPLGLYDRVCVPRYNPTVSALLQQTNVAPDSSRYGVIAVHALISVILLPALLVCRYSVTVHGS